MGIQCCSPSEGILSEILGDSTSISTKKLNSAVEILCAKAAAEFSAVTMLFHSLFDCCKSSEEACSSYSSRLSTSLCLTSSEKACASYFSSLFGTGRRQFSFEDVKNQCTAFYASGKSSLVWAAQSTILLAQRLGKKYNLPFERVEINTKEFTRLEDFAGMLQSAAERSAEVCYRILPQVREWLSSCSQSLSSCIPTDKIIEVSSSFWEAANTTLANGI